MAGNDAAQKLKTEDYLGYNTYAQTLWGRIERALQKAGDQPGDDPLVVGLFGEWGAGKSKLLQLIAEIAKNELAQQQKQTSGALKLTVPVLFQPWKYEHEPHLHVPLVMHVMQALREALKGHRGFVKKSEVAITDAANKGAKALTLVHHGASLGAKIFSPIKKTVAALSLFGLNIDLPEEIEDWLNDVADITVSAPEAAKKLEKKKTKQAEKLSKKQVIYSEDGLYFYRINEFLRKITRPGADADIKAQAQAESIDKNTEINFVIFIDDLDRCLPEKAVETLELIKTVFNLESFAFVLALDEEVVERGIGHRYKDYSFQGKKPEMPITGFEYLEKIVHLPFRLPAITYRQALNFIANIEKSIQPEPDKTLSHEEREMADRRLFFSYSESRVGMRVGDRLGFDERPTELTELLLASFDYFVPRKLLRAVELMYQIDRVASVRGKGMSYRRSNFQTENSNQLQSANYAAQSESFQTVLFGLLILQLFQPEIYRVIRRKQASLGSWLGGFLSDKPEWNDANDVSELSLWQWAVTFSHQPLLDPARAEELKEFSNITSLESATLFLGKNFQLTNTQRYLAQQVRLPLVHRLCEHIRTERHAFNPFKWAQTMATVLGDQGLRQLKIQDYLEYLSEDSSLPQKTGVQAQTQQSSGSEVSPRNFSEVKLNPSTLEKIYERAVSNDFGILGELPEYLQAYVGQIFDAETSAKLLAKLKAAQLDRDHLLPGLALLAPHIPSSYAKQYWELVKPAEGVEIYGQQHVNLEQLHERNRYAKVKSSLGQDQRFNPAAFHLTAPSKEKWIENFVNIPETLNFKLHSGSEIKRLPEFYIAKYLTTVDQFAHFVNARGYGELGGERPAWWDPVGWLWRNDGWNNQLEYPWAKDGTKQRPKEARSQPMRWQEQLAVGSHPVIRLNWFEARAYCRWLDAQLKNHPERQGRRFQVSLPTEAQWERAARAKNAAEADAPQYPWGDDSSHVELLANIDQSKLGERSIVGLFPASPIGLYDLSGNLWEWQNNLSGKIEDAPLSKDLGDLKRGEEFDSSDSLALRGGSWFFHASDARASFRAMNRPDYWNYDVGFRVVLSLAS